MYHAAEDRGSMPPSFVVELAVLLAFGPVAALGAATAGAVIKRRAASGVAAIVATAAASYVHGALGGTIGTFNWPLEGVPVAGAVFAYSFINVISMQVATPLVMRQPVNRGWPGAFVRECPTYFVGAGLAAGTVELISHRAWQFMPVAAVSLFFAFGAYRRHLSRLEEEQRRREVIDAVDDGMCGVDRNGRVTLWSDG